MAQGALAPAWDEPCSLAPVYGKNQNTTQEPSEVMAQRQPRASCVAGAHRVVYS